MMAVFIAIHISIIFIIIGEMKGITALTLTALGTYIYYYARAVKGKNCRTE
jgi:uncharacterized membrane protein